MKTTKRPTRCRFQLRLFSYGSEYYINRIAILERLVKRQPRWLEIELIGVGEVPADFALLIRSILLGRSQRTRVITHARSSLHGASFLVWLLGDQRVIREDAHVYFRRAKMAGIETASPDENWKALDEKFDDNDIEPEEADYARALQVIDEFLPVNELAGRIVGTPVLRQLGLVANEKMDELLAKAFKETEPALAHR